MARSLAAFFSSFTSAHSSSNHSLYVFLYSRWCLSLLSGLFLPVFYIFHPSLVVELAHLGVQTQACGVNLFHLGSLIAAITILYFLSSFIVIRRPPGLYSDHTFQVANCKSFLRLLLIFIVLICPIFSSFTFVIRVFLRGRVINPSHNLLTSEGPYCWSPFRHPVIPMQSTASQTLCVAAPLEIRHYYFSLLH
jgi:hypothetical protein